MKASLLNLVVGLSFTSTPLLAQNYVDKWLLPDGQSSALTVPDSFSTSKKPSNNWQQQNKTPPSAMSQSILNTPKNQPARNSLITGCAVDSVDTSDNPSDSFWTKRAPSQMARGCMKTDPCFRTPGPIESDCGRRPIAADFPRVQ